MRYVTIDIETKGLAINSEITMIGIKYVGYSDIHGKHIYNFANADIISECIKALEKIAMEIKAKTSQSILYNGKFDTARILFNLGIDIPVSHDAMFLVYLHSTADELKDNRGHWMSLKDSAMRLLEVEDWDISLKDKTAGGEALKPYLEKDLDYTFQIFQKLYPTLDTTAINTYKLLLYSANVYKYTEVRGFPFDLNQLNKVLEAKLTEQKILGEELKNQYDINYASPKQLIELLFVRLGLPETARTETGLPSTGVEALTNLIGLHPIIEQILAKRSLDKAIGFLQDWKERAINGRLHANFNLTNTTTGRTSCSEPNLQQVPRNKELKSVFRSTDPEWELVQFDYSQAELRFCAIIAQVKNMKQAYINDQDLHYVMAAQITGKEIKDITKDERTSAKAANFGYIYSMGPESFREYAKINYGVNLTPTEAALIRKKFFALYPELELYHKASRRILSSTGIITSIFGRDFKVNMRTLAQKAKLHMYERSAINFPIQSAASDYALLGLVEINHLIQPTQARLVLTVHDSVLLEVKKNDYFYQTLDKIKGIMEKPSLVKKVLDPNIEIDIPIKVDVEIGPWGKGVSIEEYYRTFMPGAQFLYHTREGLKPLMLKGIRRNNFSPDSSIVPSKLLDDEGRIKQEFLLTPYSVPREYGEELYKLFSGYVPEDMVPPTLTLRDRLDVARDVDRTGHVTGVRPLDLKGRITADSLPDFIGSDLIKDSIDSMSHILPLDTHSTTLAGHLTGVKSIASKVGVDDMYDSIAGLLSHEDTKKISALADGYLHNPQRMRIITDHTNKYRGMERFSHWEPAGPYTIALYGDSKKRPAHIVSKAKISLLFNDTLSLDLKALTIQQILDLLETY